MAIFNLTDEKRQRTLVNGVSEAFPRILCPVLYEEKFDTGSIDERKIITRTWLDAFNEAWRTETRIGSNTSVEILHALVAHYYQWIAKITSYVEPIWYAQDEFSGSFASLIRLTESRNTDNLPAVYIKIIQQLWFESPSNAHELIGEIYEMNHAGKIVHAGTQPSDSPYWGMLVPNIAWDVINALPHDFPDRDSYEAIAAWLCTSAALYMHQPLHTHKEPKALAWHALMWHTFKNEEINIFNYHGINLHQLLLKQPTVTKLIALPPLANVTFASIRDELAASPTTPIAQPISGPVTLYNAFRAWTTDMEKYISIAQATELTAWEIIEFYLSETAKKEDTSAEGSTTTSVTLPTDLADVT